MDSNFNLLVDFILMAMLCIAIYYGVRLHGQIKLLRNARHELNQQLKAFASENKKAQDNILKMQENAAQNYAILERLLKEGEPLKHELASLIKSAESAKKKIVRDDPPHTKRAAFHQESHFTAAREPAIERISRDRMDQFEQTQAPQAGKASLSQASSRAKSGKKSALLDALRMMES